MNKKVKKLWVRALRSGEFKQCKEKLVHGNQYGPTYCCLGVAAKLAVDNGVCSRKDAFKGNDFLTKPVMKWMEVENNNPFIKSKRNNLSGLNDNGCSFEEIADCIDKNL